MNDELYLGVSLVANQLSGKNIKQKKHDNWRLHTKTLSTYLNEMQVLDEVVTRQRAGQVFFVRVIHQRTGLHRTL